MKKGTVSAEKEAFTLIELMVSTAVLLLLLFVLLSLTDTTRRTWFYTSGKLEQFRSARQALEGMTRQISQATLNTYWDYDDPTSPNRYLRRSELRFVAGDGATLTGNPKVTGHAVFFQAPLGFSTEPNNKFEGLNTLMNTLGYFVEFGDDAKNRPSFVNPQTYPLRHRFRLMEMMESSEQLTLYKYTNGNPNYNGREWFTEPLAGSPRAARVLAENVISLVLLPRLSPEEDASGTLLAPEYSYDSTSAKADAAINPKNQLPPSIQVTLAAVDEGSFGRFQNRHGTNFPTSLQLESLFRQAGNLTDPSKPGYAQDISTLEKTLRENQINYRLFTTVVSINAAKWSREQNN